MNDLIGKIVVKILNQMFQKIYSRVIKSRNRELSFN